MRNALGVVVNIVAAYGDKERMMLAQLFEVLQ
jgi:hypothetical protein